MSNQAIGMIETRGYVPALASADAMVKAAKVEIVSRNEVGGEDVDDETDEQGHAEAPDRARAEHPEGAGGEQRGQVGVDDGGGYGGVWPDL